LKTEVSINNFCLDEEQRQECAIPEAEILMYISLKDWEIGLLNGTQSTRTLA